MLAEVRGTALGLLERFAIAGSLEEHPMMHPAKQSFSHPERDGSRGFAQTDFRLLAFPPCGHRKNP
jgi:hypothetical protein